MLLLFAAIAWGTVVLDRIAAVVDTHAVKRSDIDRDIRVTQFLNNAPPAMSPELRKEALERLIDQELIRREMTVAGIETNVDAEAAATWKQLVADRFGGSAAKRDATLRRYGLSEQELLRRLAWQLTVLRFIDQRFRLGAANADAAEVDRNFEQWLAQARKNTLIEYKTGALE